jgi:hypothetical protein
MVTSSKVTVTIASQASVAVASPNTGVAGHSTVAGGFGHVIVGGVLSVTLIDLLQVDVFPQSSSAVHVLVMVNSAAQGPDVVTSAKVTLTLLSQRSVAVAVPNGGAVAGHSTLETGSGHVMTGSVVSITVMDRLPVAEFPQSSTAVQVRVTVYSAAQSPAMVTSSNVISTVPSHTSVAVAIPKSGTPGHSTVGAGFGHVKVGGVLSVTVKV